MGSGHERRVTLAGQRGSGTEKLNVLFTWDARPALRDYLARGLADVPGLRLLYPEPTSAVAGATVPGAGVTVSSTVSATPVAPAATEADVMIGWRPTRALLEAAPRLRVWINPGAGIGHLVELLREVNAGRERPIVLVNGHGNAAFVAQHAVALLLALANRVVLHHRWMAEGLWRRGDAEAASIPLGGRTVGLLGYGHINQRVHRLLSGFDVDVAILRRAWSSDNEEATVPPALRFTPDRLGAFLDVVDILIIAVPETAETTGLIDRAALGRLGPRGLLVNVARGPVVVEADLFAALRDGAIAGAALDVWYDYQPAPDAEGRRYPYHAPFHSLDNVVLSPHRAASPLDDLARWDEVIDNLRRIAAGRSDLRNVVHLARGY